MVFASLHPEMIAMFIPVLFVIGGVMVAITAVIINGRQKDHQHRERLMAMERGLEVPAPPEKELRPVHSGRRAGGLVMTGIGLAITMGITVSDGFETGVWGLIPMFIGLGLLIAGFLDKKEYEQQKRERMAERDRSGPPSTM